ncbi:MAG: hypothetical protein ACK5M3_16095 [Dysgonomonas sp.]
MKTDFYTKTVLTVIAIFLGIIAFRNVDFITPAQAQKSALSPRKDVIDVNIVSTSSPVDVNLTKYAGTKLKQYDRRNYEQAFEYYGDEMLAIPMTSSYNSSSKIETKPIDVNIVQYAGNKLEKQTNSYDNLLNYITFKIKE